MIFLSRDGHVRQCQADPQAVDLKDELAKRHLLTGVQLMKMKRFSEALSNLRETIRIGNDLAARRPPVGFSRAVLAESWLHAGQIEARSGRQAAACKAFRRSAGEYDQTKAEGAFRIVEEQFSVEAGKAAGACGTGKEP